MRVHRGWAIWWIPFVHGQNAYDRFPDHVYQHHYYQTTDEEKVSWKQKIMVICNASKCMIEKGRERTGPLILHDHLRVSAPRRRLIDYAKKEKGTKDQNSVVGYNNKNSDNAIARERASTREATGPSGSVSNNRLRQVGAGHWTCHGKQSGWEKTWASLTWAGLRLEGLVQTKDSSTIRGRPGHG